MVNIYHINKELGLSDRKKLEEMYTASHGSDAINPAFDATPEKVIFSVSGLKSLKR